MDVNSSDERGNTALMVAAASGLDNIVELFIRSGADVNAINFDGKTALHMALENKQSLVVSFILSMAGGLKVDVADKWGNTPLIIAAKNNDIENVRMLLMRHANPNHQNKNGDTALHMAVKIANQEMVQELLKYKAKVNVANHQGITPLQLADSYQLTGIAQLLKKK
jgi:ankyrin repeat protein